MVKRRNRSGASSRASSISGSPRSLDFNGDSSFVHVDIIEDHNDKTPTETEEYCNAEEEIQRLRDQVMMLKQTIRKLEHEQRYPPDDLPILTGCATSSEMGTRLLKRKQSDVATSPPRRNISSKSANPNNYNMTFWESVKDRSTWLVGLLIFQSCSSFILARNDELLQQHPVIVHFLTMLVGAGGNAGNQASVRVIRGLAMGTLHAKNIRQFLIREFHMAVTLTAILSAAGFLRAAVLAQTNVQETLAITSSLALIVFTSVCLGALLPLLLQRMRLDPAHSSTTIQVVMDILGVVFTVHVSLMVLSSTTTSIVTNIMKEDSSVDFTNVVPEEMDDLWEKVTR